MIKIARCNNIVGSLTCLDDYAADKLTTNRNFMIELLYV